MDTAWLVKRVGQKKDVLDVLCEREGVFQRLPQTTPENLSSHIKAYTIDPKVSVIVEGYFSVCRSLYIQVDYVCLNIVPFKTQL